MEDNNSKKPVAFKAKPDTRERAKKLMEKYREKHKTGEDLLVDLLDAMDEKESRIEHPAFSDNFRSIDEYINTLKTRVNSIVVTADSEIADLKRKHEEAITEKLEMKEKAAEALAEANELKAEAEAMIEKAKAEIEEANSNARKEINRVKETTGKEVEMAIAERDHVLWEIKDARAVAEAKTASNEILTQQLSRMEEELSELGTLRDRLADAEKANKEMRRQLDVIRNEMAQKQRDWEQDLKNHERESAEAARDAARNAEKVRDEAIRSVEKKYENEIDHLKDEIRACRSEADCARKDAANAKALAHSEMAEKYQEEIKELRSLLDARTSALLEANSNHLKLDQAAGQKKAE